MKFKKGFTLLELLVVIAILGLLSTIAIAALQESRAKARDAKRIADLNQIGKALELFNDENGRYPSLAAPCDAGGGAEGGGTGTYTLYSNGSGYGANCDWDSLEVLLAGLIGNFPSDETGQNWLWTNAETFGFQYVVEDDGSAYELITRLETGATHPQSCASVGYTHYTNELSNGFWNGAGSADVGDSLCGAGSSCTGAGLGANECDDLYSHPH